MTDPSASETAFNVAHQAFLGYLIFALTAASVNMWTFTGLIHWRWRTYVTSVTFACAAIVIYLNTDVYDSVAGSCAVLALLAAMRWLGLRKRNDRRRSKW